MVALGAQRSKEAEEQGDILRTIAQGGYFDGHRIEAEEQVFTEAPSLDGLLEIDIRRSDDAHVGLERLARTDGNEFARLQHT